MKHVLKKTALLAGLACLAGMVQAQKPPVVLRVHHFLGPQSVQHTVMLGDWCRQIEKDSKGRLQCQIFPAMQLGGSAPQLFDQVKDGLVDVAWTAPGYTASRFARSQVFELPFTMSNAAATSRAAWDFVQKHAQDEYKDVKLLAIHVHGPGVIFTKNRPITRLEDLRGLKIRSSTATVSRMLGLMGATPVGMPVPQVPDALSKGLIDGAMVPYEVAPGLKLHELSRYAAETDAGFPALYTTVFVMSMNKARYEALPADLKAVIDRHSGRELSATLGAQQSGRDLPSRRTFSEARDYRMSTIPAAELKRWQQATRPLNEAWVAEMDKRGLDGQRMLQDAQNLIRHYTR